MTNLSVKIAAGAMAALGLAGCGLRTPDLQSPFQTKDDEKIIVNHIVNEVKCELIKGVVKILDYDKAQAPLNGGRKLQWLETWSAQITLTITAEDKSSINPGLSLTRDFPTLSHVFSNKSTVTSPQSFTAGLGANLSADATRIDKLDFFFAFKDFLESGNARNHGASPCTHYSDILIESDLKLGEWLDIATFPNYTDSIVAPNGFTLPMSAISHHVTFLIIAGGNITPSWKLVDASVNSGNSPFLGGSRNKTDDLLITIGPTADADAQAVKTARGPVKKAAPSQAAANSHLASEIGAAVAAAIRNN